MLILFASEKETTGYERIELDLNTPDDLVSYWSKLNHISMNTYKFNAAKYLHDHKSDQQQQSSKMSMCSSRPLDEIARVWSIEKSNNSDHMGPGGYDSRLSLNNFKNWTISQRNGAAAVSAKSSSMNKAITKQADTSRVPVCELALMFPFGVFPTENQAASQSQQRRVVPAARKSSRQPKKKRFEDESESEHGGDSESVPQVSSKKPRKLASVDLKDLKRQKAKQLVEKAAFSN